VTPSHPCPHCATPVEGPEGMFCCSGCEAAHALLADAGLEGWYEKRQQPAPRSREASAVDWSCLPVEAHADGTVSALLQIGDLRCASCVWVTEKLLERSPGVRSVTVSFATGRTRLRWDPSATTLDALAGRIATIGYTPRPAGVTGDADRDLLVRAGVAVFGMMNVMGLDAALYVGWMDGMDDRFAQLMRWLGLAVAAPVALWSAMPFYEGALRGLRARVIHMDLPIALAILGMFAHGVWTTVHHADAWLDSMTMLVSLLLIGRALEARGRRRTAEAAATLAATAPRSARRVVEDGVELVPSSSLRPGDHIELGTGDEVPADGVIVSGEAQARMSVLTGEAEPVSVRTGDRLVTGASVEQGAVRLAVTHTGDDTLLARMVRGLETAGAAPRQPTPEDRLAPAFTLGTLLVAGAVIAWHIDQPDVALERAVAVLVVACPCALALARPLIGAAGLASAARRGLLLRSEAALDRLSRVDAALLDKTGTVTSGRPVVVAAEDDALRVAAALERSSRHPVALAILDAAAQRRIPFPAATEVAETAGRGIQGRVDGLLWRLQSGGPGAVALSCEDGRASLLQLRDVPRADASDDLHLLRERLDHLALLTGDRAQVARAIASGSPFDEVIAEADPEAKVAQVERLQAAGRRVLLVGDGINDAPALARASVGIAMADAAAPSLAAADGVLMADTLRPLVAGVEVARLTQRRIGRSMLRSGIYNVLAVTAAVLGLVNPLVAAVLMPLSSGLVLLSAATLDRAVKVERRAPQVAPTPVVA
jgi:Cu2+-exporting ATPase